MHVPRTADISRYRLPISTPFFSPALPSDGEMSEEINPRPEPSVGSGKSVSSPPEEVCFSIPLPASTSAAGEGIGAGVDGRRLGSNSVGDRVDGALEGCFVGIGEGLSVG